MNRDLTTGVILLILAMMALACMDALSKWLSTRYPVAQILAVRFFIFTVFALAIIRPRRLRHAFQTQHPYLQIARGLVLSVEVAVFVVALRYLPLADMHAIAGIAPLIATGLAVLFLGEAMTWSRWIPIGCGFLGLLLIIRPGAIPLNSPALLPLLGATLWAIYQILVRKVRADPPSTSLFYIAVTGFLLSAVLAPFFWIPPDRQGWFMLIALGLIGTLGHYLLIQAFCFAQASSLQPYNYTILIWATLLGILVYGEFPDIWTIAGGVIIAISSICALYQSPSSTSSPIR